MLDVKEKAKELGQIFSRKQILEYMRFQDHRYALKRAFLGGEVQTGGVNDRGRPPDAGRPRSSVLPSDRAREFRVRPDCSSESVRRDRAR